jgi:hypothetical protein
VQLPLFQRLFAPSPKRRLRRLRAEYQVDSDARTLDLDWTAANYNRIAVVNLLLAGNPDGRYLEIGCAGNDLFDAVMAKHKIGVDPERGGTHRMTSDEFFRTDAGARYDVVFIDGLHIYEQAHRDVVNALAHVAPGGWIALHDMMPRTWLEEHVPRISGVWTGNVWKVAFELARSADIDFRLLRIDHGVGVLRVLKEGAKIPDLHAELADKRFGHFYDNLARLPVVDYATGRDWIEQSLGAARLHPHI